MVNVIAEPERSFLDEPLFTRPLAVTPRRLLYLGLYAATAYLALTRLPPGPKVWLPGLEVEAGVVHLAVLLGALPLIVLAFWDAPVRPETQLAWLLLGRRESVGKPRKRKAKTVRKVREGEEAKPKTIKLRASPDGYAALTLTGRIDREATIVVVVDGVELRRLKALGTWTVRIELESGEHDVEVRSLEPPAVLAAYKVIVRR